jgi:transcriptional regulator
MYIPAAFRVDDLSALHAFMRRYSFATLVTASDEPFVTRLPLLLDAASGPYGTLIGHFARPNPHGQLDHSRHASVAMFDGPHAYVSPSWYSSGVPAVPTWNYTSVHAWGTLALLSDPADVTAVLDRMVEVYESSSQAPWKNTLPLDMLDKLIASVVAFRMPIERTEGKFKLGQNRSTADQLGAIEALEASGQSASMSLADFARTHLGYPAANPGDAR